MNRLQKRRIVADVFGTESVTRPLVAEPLTADDWRRVWEANRNYVAALRQIVVDVRLREATKTLGDQAGDA